MVHFYCIFYQILGILKIRYGPTAVDIIDRDMLQPVNFTIPYIYCKKSASLLVPHKFLDVQKLPCIISPNPIITIQPKVCVILIQNKGPHHQFFSMET